MSGPTRTAVLAGDTVHPVRLRLNGAVRQGSAQPRLLLSDFLRHELGATGTHVGCEHGVCGACTVRIDGVAQRACMTLAVQVDGREVQTVEGLAVAEAPLDANPIGADARPGGDRRLGDLQAAFRRHHALQCGFCTAGILMSCADWLDRVDDPSEDAVRQMLSGHLCRCTGYTPIVAAVLDVARRRQAVASARQPEARDA